MKLKSILLTFLSAVFMFSLSFAVTFSGKTTKQNVSATENGWQTLYDVESEGEVNFTNNKTAFLYNSVKGLGVHFSNDTKLTYKQKVNVKALTSDFNILQFYVDPVTKDATAENAKVEFSDVILRLENWDNPNEYIEINQFNSIHNSSLSWAVASTNTMTAFGMKQGVIHNTVRRGTPVYGSFSGASDKKISLRYDYILNTAFSFDSLYNEANYGGYKNMVRTFDNPKQVLASEELFHGFSSDYVRMSITLTGVADELVGGNIIFTNVLGQKYLTTNVDDGAVDTEKPLLLFGDDFDENNIPLAEVGTAYPMYDVIGYDVFDGPINDIGYKIYYLGEDENGAKTDPIITKNNLVSFTPDKVGYYDIDISIVDNAGNTNSKTIKVKTVNAVEVLKATLNGDIKTTASLGETITIPTYNISGGSGIIKENVIVTNPKNEEIKVVNNKFIATDNGCYIVKYIFSDYLGKEFIILKQIRVSVSSYPVLGDVVVPTYLKANNFIDLNVPKAIDYASYLGEAREVPVDVYVAENDKNGTYVKVDINELGKLRYTPSKTATSLFVKYKASSLLNVDKVFESEPKEIKILSPKDLHEYFVLNGGITKQYETVETRPDDLKEMVYTVNEKGSYIEFINPLRAGGFSTILNFDYKQSHFKKITIKLSDSVNVAETVTISLTTSREEDGKIDYLTGAGDIGTSKGRIYNVTDPTASARVVINNKTKLVDDTNTAILTISAFDNGDVFNGFSSKRIYVKIIFDDFEEDKVNKFRFSNFYSINTLFEGVTDLGRPVIESDGSIPSYAILMDNITIPAATGYDVISPNCNTFVSLRDPKGNYIIGSNTAGVLANKPYEVFVNVPGKYLLEYSSADETGVLRRYTYQINTIDTVVPRLEINGQIKSTYKLGEALVLPEASVIDNSTTDDGIKFYIYLETPGYGRKTLRVNNKIETYVFKRVGNYTLTYFAMDSSSNYVEKTFKISVSE